MAAACLCGCARAPGQTIVENPIGPARKVTIEFSFWGGDTEMADFHALAERFVQEHPEIRVRLSNLPWGQYWTKLRTKVAAGIAPDVIRLYSGEAAQWFERGVLENLGPYVEHDGIDLGEYFDVAIEACRWEGKLYSLPSDVPVRILIYNKTLFDRARLPYPDPREPMTWEELLETAQRLTIVRDGRTVQYGLALGPQAEFIFVGQAGGSFVEPLVNPQRATSDDAAVIDGLKFFHDLQFTWKVAPDRETQQAAGFGTGEAPLLGGNVAMGMAGPWTFRTYSQTDLRLGLAPLWRGTHRYQICTPNSNGVYSNSPHKEQAWQFVKFLASQEGQRIIGRRGVGIPSLKRIARSPAFLENEYGFTNLEAYGDDLEYARPLVMAPTGEVLQKIAKILSHYRLGIVDAPGAAAELQSELTQAIAAQSPRPPGLWVGVILPVLLLAIILTLAVLLYRGSRRLAPRLAETGRQRNLLGYLFIAPWLIGLVVFNLGPILAAVLLGFTHWDMVLPPRWVGLGNYVEMGKDVTFWKSILVTVLYAVPSVIIAVGGGLGVALLLHQKVRGRGAFRTLFYLPSLFSGVAFTLLWVWMYNPRLGVINYLLGRIGLEGPNWLDSPRWVLPALILMNVLWIGGNMLIFLVALEGVPQSLYDAATVDGAGRLRRFRHVTLPMLSPAILFTCIIGTIGAFQVFTEAFMIKPPGGDLGGPADWSMFYVLHVYIRAFIHLRMGYACALALILFALIFALTYLQLQASRRWVYYEAEEGA